MDRDKNDCSCTPKVRYWKQAVLPVIVGLRGRVWRVFGFLGMSRNSHFDIVAEVATLGGCATPAVASHALGDVDRWPMVWWQFFARLPRGAVIYRPSE